jgi:hypothetical protein
MQKSLGRLWSIAAGIALLAGTSSAFGHHAFAAEFDATRPLDLSGVVTEAKWVNPHAWLYLDARGRDGSVTNWGFEFGAPNVMEDRGLKKEYLQPGTHVHIRGFRSKSGEPIGYAVTLTLRDGRTYKTGGVDCPAIGDDRTPDQVAPTFLGPPRH